MDLAQELERLARLHAEGVLTAEEFARAKSRVLAGPGSLGFAGFGVRRQSSRTLWGLPLWAVAVGPDPQRGEWRGHARAVFAFGDLATGVFACGGLARGVVAFGGLAVGFLSFGGLAVGVLLAVGGAALGGIALGGGAVGAVAIGGAACGYYALGSAAAGAHTVSVLHQDPEAVRFFGQYAPWLGKLLGR